MKKYSVYNFILVWARIVRRSPGAKFLHQAQYLEEMTQEPTVFGQFLNNGLAEYQTPPVYNFIVLGQPLVEVDWLEDGLLLYTEYPNFKVDPNTGKVDFGERFTYVFNPETKERCLAPELQPQINEQCRAFLAPGDHTYMAEACVGTANHDSLRVLNIDGSDPVTIIDPYSKGAIEWSADGERLAFVGNDEQGKRQLFTWNRGNGGIQQITHVDSETEISFIALSWSPDNKQWWQK